MHHQRERNAGQELVKIMEESLRVKRKSFSQFYRKEMGTKMQVLGRKFKSSSLNSLDMSWGIGVLFNFFS